MVTRRRVHRWALRAVASLAPLSVLLYLVSVAGMLTHSAPGRTLSIGRGAILLSEGNPGAANADSGWHFWRPTHPWYILPRWQEQSGAGRLVIVPFWMPLAAGLLAGYFLLPRGFPRGHCQRCGFDLKGLPAGDAGAPRVLCPECGGETPRPAAGEATEPDRP